MSDIQRKFVKRLNDEWEVYLSVKHPGTYFYFNVRTGKTSWEPPDTVEGVQIKKQTDCEDSDTDPDCVIEKAKIRTKNIDTRSPDKPQVERDLKVMNEVRGIRVMMEEQKFRQPSWSETIFSGLEPPGRPYHLSSRNNAKRKCLNSKEESSDGQGCGRVKLKRSWVNSDSPSDTSERHHATRRSSDDQSKEQIAKRHSNEVVTLSSTRRNDRTIQEKAAERTDTVKQMPPTAGIAEKRLIRIRKALENQRNQPVRKNNNASSTSMPEKRNLATASDTICGKRATSPTRSTAVKRYERLSSEEGNLTSAGETISGKCVVSPTRKSAAKHCEFFPNVQGSKKNIAANRLKALQDKLVKVQKARAKQSQSSSLHSNETIRVVVPDSHRGSDEAEFLEAEEKMLMDVQELREEIHKAGGVNPEEVEEMICEIVPSSFPETKSKLYIVTDTNVLVSNFQAVERLCNTNVEGIGCPVFIIPWMVLHELDILKDRRDVMKSNLTAVRAQKAIIFLHKCFSSKHPRVIGQTVSDAGPDALSTLCNPDNSILQCCLQQVKLGRKVLLLSDDKNLQNKCMVNGIDAVGKSDLKNYLQTLTKENKNELNARDTHSTTTVVSKVEEAISKVNILVTNLKLCAKEVLSKVILQEMKVAYGNKWSEIICVKPPFSLDDIFVCLTKHWWAVFGLIMSKNSMATIKELKNFCGSEDGSIKGSAESVEDVKNIAIKFGRLLSELAKPLYSQLIKDAQLFLEDLICACENPFSCPEMKNAVSFSEPSSDWVVSRHMAVVEKLRKIWAALVELCQQLRTVIAQNRTPFQIGTNISVSEEDLKTWVAYVYGPVSNLYFEMESVAGAAEAQQTNTEEMLSVVNQMHRDFCELYRLISSGEHIGFDIEDLISFCEDQEARDIIKEIKEQFHNFGVIMRQAIDYFSAKDILPFSDNRNENGNTNDVEMEEQFSNED